MGARGQLGTLTVLIWVGIVVAAAPAAKPAAAAPKAAAGALQPASAPVAATASGTAASTATAAVTTKIQDKADAAGAAASAGDSAFDDTALKKAFDGDGSFEAELQANEAKWDKKDKEEDDRLKSLLAQLDSDGKSLNDESAKIDSSLKAEDAKLAEDDKDLKLNSDKILDSIKKDKEDTLSRMQKEHEADKKAAKGSKLALVQTAEGSSATLDPTIDIDTVAAPDSSDLGLSLPANLPVTDLAEDDDDLSEMSAANDAPMPSMDLAESTAEPDDEGRKRIKELADWAQTMLNKYKDMTDSKNATTIQDQLDTIEKALADGKTQEELSSLDFHDTVGHYCLELGFCHKHGDCWGRKGCHCHPPYTGRDCSIGPDSADSSTAAPATAADDHTASEETKEAADDVKKEADKAAEEVDKAAKDAEKTAENLGKDAENTVKDTAKAATGLAVHSLPGPVGSLVSNPSETTGTGERLAGPGTAPTVDSNSASGTGTEGTACVQAADCAKGTHCVDGQCRVLTATSSIFDVDPLPASSNVPMNVGTTSGASDVVSSGSPTDAYDSNPSAKVGAGSDYQKTTFYLSSTSTVNVKTVDAECAQDSFGRDVCDPDVTLKPNSQQLTGDAPKELEVNYNCITHTIFDGEKSGIVTMTVTTANDEKVSWRVIKTCPKLTATKFWKWIAMFVIVACCMLFVACCMLACFVFFIDPSYIKKVLKIHHKDKREANEPLNPSGVEP